MKHSKHTPEPWIADETTVFADSPTSVAVASCGDQIQDSPPIQSANAARIVACVNACAGLNPEAIPALVEAAEAMLATIHGYCADPDDDDPATIMLPRWRAALAAVIG